MHTYRKILVSWGLALSKWFSQSTEKDGFLYAMTEIERAGPSIRADVIRELQLQAEGSGDPFDQGVLEACTFATLKGEEKCQYP